MKKLTEFDSEIAEAMKSGIAQYHQSAKRQTFDLKGRLAIDNGPELRIFLNTPLDAKEKQAIMEAGDWLMNFIRNNRGIK